MYDTMTQYFLREKIDHTDNVYVITLGRETLLGSVPSSTHLEADYRIIIHVLDGIERGYETTTVSR